MTITVCSGKAGSRHWLNHRSNKLCSIVPSNTSGAMISRPNLAATIPTRLYLRPLTSPISRWPLGDQPYSRYKYESIPLSSTYAICSDRYRAISSKYAFTFSGSCSLKRFVFFSCEAQPSQRFQNRRGGASKLLRDLLQVCVRMAFYVRLQLFRVELLKRMFPWLVFDLPSFCQPLFPFLNCSD